MSFRETDCFLVIGMRGSGKSYLGRRIQSVYPRKVIFDTLGEYDNDEYRAENPSARFVYSFREFCEAVKGLEHAQRYTLVYQFDEESEVSDEEFNQAMRVLYYLGNVFIVVEEVQSFSTTHKLPHWLKVQLLKGRHRGNGLLFTTQRPGELHKTILSQCTHFFAGQIHETNDLAYLKPIFKEKTQYLAKIEQRKFLYFRPGHDIVLVNNDLKS